MQLGRRRNKIAWKDAINTERALKKSAFLGKRTRANFEGSGDSQAALE